MKGCIPIEQIGNLHIRIDDLINALCNGAVLAALEPAHLTRLERAIAIEMVARTPKATG
jgi:hypothetical protein